MPSSSASSSNAQPNAQQVDAQRGASPSSSSNFYQLLGLRPNASVQEIRRAYRDLSKLYHPDTTELESAIATVKFQALNEAYATLSNPEKRIAYDYKIGYSRLSVMQPLSQVAPGKPYDPTASAYLDPSDRPLSAGELFALFILGITFIGCLILVFTMGLDKSDLPITQSAVPANNTEPYDLSQPSNSTMPDSLFPASEPLRAPSLSPKQTNQETPESSIASPATPNL